MHQSVELGESVCLILMSADLRMHQQWLSWYLRRPTRRIVLNSILNASGKRGSGLGNAIGTLGKFLILALGILSPPKPLHSFVVHLL